jgi:hypothetical protein
VAMSGFDIAVFLRLPHVDAMTLDAVVPQQRLVLRGERLVTGQVVDRGREAVAADTTGHAACSVQGILKPRRQGLERLGMAEVNELPIRIGEDRVEQQVIERPSPDGHPQGIHRHEVEGDHIPGVVYLGEDHFLLDVVAELPMCDAAFQGAADRVGDHRFAARLVVLLLEPFQNGDRFQPGVLRQERFYLGPVIRQGIFASAIVARHLLELAGQLAYIPILSDRLLTHSQLPCNTCYRLPLVEHHQRHTHLPVRGHRKPPVCSSLRITCHEPGDRGNASCQGNVPCNASINSTAVLIVPPLQNSWVGFGHERC